MSNYFQHFDHVGSYLRPEKLLVAREDYAAGKISKEDLRKIEDEAIRDLIAQQEAVGLKVVTDGEFRRASWHCDFFWGLQGVEEIQNVDQGTVFAGKTYGITARLKGRVSGENHPFVDHWKFARSVASDQVEVKQTIPAPSQFVQEVLRDINIEATRAHYDNLDDLVEDTIAAYSTFLSDIYEAGCRIVQFDDCTWSRLIAGEDHQGQAYTEEEVEERKALFIRLNNGVIANKPEGLTINTHVCRGNFASTWFASGGYDSVADPLFTEENVNAYFLEYDTERAGTFEPLEAVPDHKKVVLGLVTSKNGELEDKADLIRRIEEASKYVPIENLALSTQCGFSSNSVGNILTEEDQWKKLRLIREVAEEVWS